MRQSASAPSIGGRGQQPPGRLHGEVTCERNDDSPSVAQLAGRSRTAAPLSQKLAGSAESARTDSQRGLPPTSAASFSKGSAATVTRPKRGRVSRVQTEEPFPTIDENNSMRQMAKDFQMDFSRGKQKFWKEFHMANNREQSSQGSQVESSVPTRTVTRRSTTSLANFVPDVKQFEEQTERLISAVADIKEKHEAFQPMTAQQRERQSLLGKRPTIQSNQPDISQLLSDEEEESAWRDKLEAWKYVRRIEPELPPLVPIPHPVEPEIHDQKIVFFNARADVLQRHSPEMRTEWIAQRSVSREAHHCVVSMVREQRRADFKKKRQADALKFAFRTPVVEEAVEEVRYPVEAKWFEFLLVTAFSVTIQEQLSLRKMSKEERKQYLEEHEERLKNSTAKGGYLIQALHLNVALKDPQTHQRMNMLSCMFSKKYQVRQERRNARTICKCLRKWTGFGVMIMYLRRYKARIMSLQRWWREICKPRLQNAIDKFSLRWLRIEKDMLTKDLKKRDSVEASFVQANATSLTYEEYASIMREHALPMEERVLPLLIDGHVRTTFIANELRARRYFLLPLIKVWEEDLRAWSREVEEWEDMQNSLRDFGVSEPVFRFPPKRPSYLPPEFGDRREEGELEVKQMILQAKANPNGGGWTKIPQKVNGKYVMAASQSSNEGDFGDVDDEDLKQFGISTDFP